MSVINFIPKQWITTFIPCAEVKEIERCYWGRKIERKCIEDLISKIAHFIKKMLSFITRENREVTISSKENPRRFSDLEEAEKTVRDRAKAYICIYDQKLKALASLHRFHIEGLINYINTYQDLFSKENEEQLKRYKNDFNSPELNLKTMSQSYEQLKKNVEKFLSQKQDNQVKHNFIKIFNLYIKKTKEYKNFLKKDPYLSQLRQQKIQAIQKLKKLQSHANSL